ncbi:hypothetical protein AB0M72_29945 [Nocardiopsis dassonvillei]
MDSTPPTKPFHVRVPGDVPAPRPAGAGRNPRARPLPRPLADRRLVSVAGTALDVLLCVAFVTLAVQVLRRRERAPDTP